MRIGNGREASSHTRQTRIVGREAADKAGMGVEGASRVKMASPQMALLEVTGKWGACGWSVVQLIYDGRGDPLFGRYGTVQAELEVQRTSKRA